MKVGKTINLLIFKFVNYFKIKLINLFIFSLTWGLGIGDWGLGIGDWGLGPIPNPQSPLIINHKK